MASSITYSIRKLISKKKRRYEADGYNLDLSYVSERIIAMGFPSEHIESMYRNSLEEVRRFLEDKHKDHYKIYNLCAERAYDIQKFHSRVAVYPFDDHSPPEFGQMLPFCEDVARWLAEDEDNIAAVHCKAGKGRTGLMICAYLLFCGKFTTAVSVLDFYGSARTFDSNGVTLPSQRRYVDYFSNNLMKGLQYNPVKMFLTDIAIGPLPHIGFGHHEAHLQFEVHQALAPPFLSSVYTVTLTEDKVTMKLEPPLLVAGDVKISFSQKMNVDLLHLSTKPKFVSNVPHGKLFHFWVNTFFISQNQSTPLTHEVTKMDSSPLPLSSHFEHPSRDLRSSISSSLTPVPQVPELNGHNPSLFSQSLNNSLIPLKISKIKVWNTDDLSDEVMCRGLKRLNVNDRPPLLPVNGITKEKTAGRNGISDLSVTGTYSFNWNTKPSGHRVEVKLAKFQIDKVSKDTSGRFGENFSVTLGLIMPNHERGFKASRRPAKTTAYTVHYNSLERVKRKDRRELAS